MRCRGRDADRRAAEAARSSPADSGEAEEEDEESEGETGPVSIYTDGSCRGNPGPGGWGLVLVRGGRAIEERNGTSQATTNNRMEFTAIIEALKLAPKGAPVTIYSDSKLAVQTLTSWAAGWEKRGWRRKDGEVKNLDLVKKAWTLLNSRADVSIEWIAGHSGHRWNERADELATAYQHKETAV